MRKKLQAHMGGFEHILFDWDGVLSDSFSDQFLWFQKCCRALGKQFSFQNIGEFRSAYEEPVYKKMYEKLGFDWGKEKDAIWKLYNEHKATTLIPLYDGAKDVLMHMYFMGVEMHIATSNTKAVIQKSLRENSLENYFATIITHI